MVENGVAAVVFEIPPILVLLRNLHSPQGVTLGVLESIMFVSLVS